MHTPLQYLPTSAKARLGAFAAALSIADDGYRLDVANTTCRPGSSKRLRFRVLDADGAPVRDFAEEHGSKLHLIIVRRDLTGYQHLHPRLAVDGTWSIPLTLPTAGAYRAFADFETGGKHLTLGADLSVPGDLQPYLATRGTSTERREALVSSWPSARASDAGVLPTSAGNTKDDQ